MNGTMSSVKVVSTGTPQGCVHWYTPRMCPLVHTKDVSTGTPQGCVHWYTPRMCPLVHPKDVSFLPCCTSSILMTEGAPIPIGFLLNSQMMMFNEEIGHGPVVEDIVDWCEKSSLFLNATTTKDMYIDFSKVPPSQTDTVIHEDKVAVVDEYKYVGTD